MDNVSQINPRPRTSKPRGICRYYDSPRGCFAGDHCKFLHGKPPEDPESTAPLLLSPYDQAKKCRYYIQGYCKRGDSCWFRHTSDDGPSSSQVSIESDDEDTCSICFEKATTFGLLGGCSHVFCISCIKQWRDPQNRPGGVLDSENTKKCPMCRTPSKFITPSSRFYKQGTEEKEKVVSAYKESMARVPCRYFQKSLQTKNKPSCPYGKDCFYQHRNADGTPHVFREGVDVAMRVSIGRAILCDLALICFKRYRNQTSRHRYLQDMFIPFSFEPSDIVDVMPSPFMGPDARQLSAVRRLRDVRDMLSDALHESASLENLQEAVEALRDNLGRLGDLNVNPETRRNVEGDDSEAARHEDEVMVHLEFMADQMLTALNALGVRDGGRGWGAESPMMDDSSDGAPSDTLHESGYTSASSVSSMPALQSVSNSPSEGSVSGDDSGDDSDIDVPVGDEATERREFLRPRESETSPVSETVSSSMPADNNETVSTGYCQPQSSSSDSAEMVEGRSNDGPPFVTDGRGRVVGTNENNNNHNEETKNEENGLNSEGWLGWFTSLF
ncbi:hypothetical protein CVT24_006765 [Panaeolus cyanescens]|uniref:RING-type E3 ubiquitin transferase n=1 Tax=Panaeolus cyanescens TaxID=181874 RepID=A0A409VDR6_9AGAR|nr:hypothetical protein CVT24_006765 [Panaeolus cyanescens]